MGYRVAITVISAFIAVSAFAAWLLDRNRNQKERNHGPDQRTVRPAQRSYRER